MTPATHSRDLAPWSNTITRRMDAMRAFVGRGADGRWHAKQLSDGEVICYGSTKYEARAEAEQRGYLFRG